MSPRVASRNSLPQRCPKCGGQKCYRDPNFRDGSAELKCSACAWVLEYIEADGETVAPSLQERERALLSTREWVAAEMGPDALATLDELGLSVYDP